MSSKYKDSRDVPTDVICDRLRELVKAITDDNGKQWYTAFYMSIPAQVDRDADIVMSEAARRLEAMEPNPWREIEDGELPAECVGKRIEVLDAIKLRVWIEKPINKDDLEIFTFTHWRYFEGPNA